MWTISTNKTNPSPKEVIDLTLSSFQKGRLQNKTLSSSLKQTNEFQTKQIEIAPEKNEINHSFAEGEANSSTVSLNEVTRFPKVLNEYKAHYPDQAKKAAVEGPVVLDVFVDNKGHVQEVTFVKGPGYGLNESAIEALKQFEFSPAMKGADAVAVKIRYTYRFKLDVN